MWSVLFLCHSLVLCFYDLIIGAALCFVNPKSRRKSICVCLRHFDEQNMRFNLCAIRFKQMISSEFFNFFPLFVAPSQFGFCFLCNSAGTFCGSAAALFQFRTFHIFIHSIFCFLPHFSPFFRMCFSHISLYLRRAARRLLGVFPRCSNFTGRFLCELMVSRFL